MLSKAIVVFPGKNPDSWSFKVGSQLKKYSETEYVGTME